MVPADALATAQDATRWLAPAGRTPSVYGNSGHMLPDDVWVRVVAEAEADPSTVRALPDRTITAHSHGGLMPGGPRLGVIHSAETPLRAGYAYSIARNWFATPQAGTSATVMIDPGETIRLLPDNVVAYHAGPRVNGFSVGVEQTGRASMTREAWTSPDGLAQLGRVARYMVECRDRWNIPLRWATDLQIRQAVGGSRPQGWCQHDDVRRVLGGTSHTDAGRGYPSDLLMVTARRLGGEIVPVRPPAPAPIPPRRTAPAILESVAMSRSVVIAAEGKAPVLFLSGIFPVELRDEGELTNALWLYHANDVGPDGKPLRDMVKGPDGKLVERPRPQWVKLGTLNELILLARTAIGAK